MTTNGLTIRKAKDEDFPGIWEIFHLVIKAGNSYVYAPTTTKEDAYNLWMSPLNQTYVCLIEDTIVGTYYIKDNHPDLGSHVSNAGYMVHPAKNGQGIGQAMAQHSFEEAKKLGYMAMQYNLVVSTNTPAINLWKKLGFEIIGKAPKSFKHSEYGYVDAYIMHRFL